MNETSIEALTDEANVYRQVGQHEGILQCFQITEHSIKLSFANQGDLMNYMKTKPPPMEKVRAEWIQSLADAFAYVHSCRVIVDDIHTQNILIHNNSPKLSDFNMSFLLPLDTDMENFSTHDTNPQIEILHLGCVFYSIAAWSEFRYDYFNDKHFPNPDELPSMNGIISGMIIRKCWMGEYTGCFYFADN
ncbi:hypothetical protein FQN55_008795 [Onygenales sp. PD_40]|nr:hypothetical protein FQN55_008795 [Onygenales sp. PD_40]